MGDSVIHSMAGAAGGIIAMTVTYPLVFLSTRASVDSGNDSKPLYQMVLDTIRREGILGLYSGLSSSLLGISVNNGIYYYFYEASREIILKSRAGSSALSTIESMIASLVAGAATAILTNPIWVIQTSQTVHTMGTSDALPGPTFRPHSPPEKSSFIGTTQRLYADGGPRAFWRGIGPSLVLVINPVLQYTVFEQAKNFLIARHSSVEAVATMAVLSDWDFFLLGAFSKLVATGITYPYIVIKHRLQAARTGSLKYKSSYHGLRTILREEGVGGLYKGASTKLVQSVLTAAILFAGERRIYEIEKSGIQWLTQC